MSQKGTSVASDGEGRPLTDSLLLRAPFLADFLAYHLVRLKPGSSLRRRAVMQGLQRGFDAVSRNDSEVALLGYELDVEILIFGATGLGFAERYDSHQGWLDFVSDFSETFAEPRYAVRRVLDAGERWVAEVEFVAHGQTSGAQVGNLWGTVFYLSPRGRIKRQDVFFQDGWKRALEAAGLSE